MPPSAIKTAETPQPLTTSEYEKMNELLARASVGQSPATRIGEPYVALTNIMVPRRGDPEKNADLVRAGEIVHLTDEEALSYGPRQGRQVAVVRKVNGPTSRREMPRIPPKAMSGRLQGPPADARPDPAGSSAIQYVEPAVVPEATEPTPGTENWDGDAGPGSGPVDAEDIIPSRVRARQTQKG